MADYIEPRVLKGFRDFLPASETVKRGLTEKIENCFRSFGYVPIDTPALEYADVLLGKGGGETEKQIYRFKDNGDRDIALRFDLTVPFARFVAQHSGELTFPFKRYHIAKVWRGENTQRGRYREFTQCDFDIIGSDSAAADFEIILLIRSVMKKLGVDVSIHVNHRGLFNRFLSHIGQNGKLTDVLRTVDKLSKIGEEETQKSLGDITGKENAEKILQFINAKGNFSQVLDRVTKLSGGSCEEAARLSCLRQYMADAVGGDMETFVFNPSITRGLDYYTGVVFETFLTELPGIGSVCSGGRYDNLAGLYSKDKNKISGVGTSIGLDRLIAALESLGKLPDANGCLLAIACVKAEHSGQYQKLAQDLRQAGVGCEVFTDSCGEKQLVKQFVLAEKKGIRYILIPSGNPSDEKITLRDIAARQNTELTINEVINMVKSNNQFMDRL
ncbi:MAG: histidine--tRNA ligase [Treponema sp.]|nr:histidine--tRNA ligase [Treponema sp.]MCL2272184.1 histidine--tRNA ligase [Treponema sp.]